MSATKDMLIDLVGGSLGAATSVYVGQPLDTLKGTQRTLIFFVSTGYETIKNLLKSLIQV